MGVVAEPGAGFGDVGAGDGDVAGLSGQAVEDSGFAEGGFEELDEAARQTVAWARAAFAGPARS